MPREEQGSDDLMGAAFRHGGQEGAAYVALYREIERLRGLNEGLLDEFNHFLVTIDEQSAEIERLRKAGDALAAALQRQSRQSPKPAPCVAHRRNDGRPDCPNCVALADWEDIRDG